MEDFFFLLFSHVKNQDYISDSLFLNVDKVSRKLASWKGSCWIRWWRWRWWSLYWMLYRFTRCKFFGSLRVFVIKLMLWLDVSFGQILSEGSCTWFLGGLSPNPSLLEGWALVVCNLLILLCLENWSGTWCTHNINFGLVWFSLYMSLMQNVFVWSQNVAPISRMLCARPGLWLRRVFLGASEEAICHFGMMNGQGGGLLNLFASSLCVHFGY